MNCFRFPDPKLGGIVSIQCQWLAGSKSSTLPVSDRCRHVPPYHSLVVPEVNGRLELREVYLEAIQPDEVLVEIHASGLCHTDLPAATGLLPCEPGAVLGHEGAGVVLSTGPAVTHVAPGDKVLLSFSYCQCCAACTSGHPANCHTFNARNFGGRRPDGTHTILASPPSTTDTHQGTGMEAKRGVFSPFFGQSSFARHTLAHRSTVVKIPPSTTEDELALYAPLGCGMQTGAGAILNTLRVREGSSVAVFGVGSVGMAAVMAATKIAGAGTVIAVDLQAGRLELARRLGATHTMLVAEGTDVVRRIREICPPNGVDYAVDCTGVTKVIRDVIDCLGTRGRAASVGAPGFGKSVSVDVMDHISHGKEYVGCCEGDSVPEKFIPFLMDAHAKGQFPFDELIRCYGFEDYKRAIEDTYSGKAIKAVLRWKC